MYRSARTYPLFGGADCSAAAGAPVHGAKTRGETMRPNRLLMDEHQVILSVLAVLEEMARRVERDGVLDEHDAGAALDFFREYADACHHAKEEDLLFPLMEARGFPRQGGPTGVMIVEHDEGRAHVRAMRDVLPPAAAGDPAAQGAFSRHARAYVGMLRQHISKEDHCLYPMADDAFGPDDEAELAERFEAVEAEQRARGVQERNVALAERLARRYGVFESLVAAPGHDHDCAHHG